MGYKINSEIFEEIIYQHVRNDKEKMKILKNTALQILSHKLSIWQCIKKQRETPYSVIEQNYLSDSRRSIAQVIYVYFNKIKENIVISFYNNEYYLNSNVFFDILDKVFEHVSFTDFAQEIINEVMEGEI